MEEILRWASSIEYFPFWPVFKLDCFCLSFFGKFKLSQKLAFVVNIFVEAVDFAFEFLDTKCSDSSWMKNFLLEGPKKMELKTCSEMTTKSTGKIILFE